MVHSSSRFQSEKECNSENRESSAALLVVFVSLFRRDLISVVKWQVSSKLIIRVKNPKQKVKKFAFSFHLVHNLL